ncbi:MAG: DUF4412 domain-containing protein [Myxococcales bacterium]|nr:MAG: DUF4412 domain-containing protein [Myxococcales bacterium]
MSSLKHKTAFVSFGVLAVLLLSQTAFASWVIEQEESIVGQDEKVVTTMTFSENAMRADNPKMNSAVIMNFDTDTMMMIQNGQKMYLEMKISVLAEQMKQMAAMMSQKEESKGEVTFTQTGEKKEISGFPCAKIVIMHQGKQIGEMWVTKEINDAEVKKVYGKFFEMADVQGGNAPRGVAAMKKALEMGFPIQVEQEMPDGAKIRSVVLSAKEKKANPLDFMPPAGFQRLTPEDIMRQQQQQMMMQQQQQGMGPGAPMSPGMPPAPPAPQAPPAPSKPDKAK